MFSDPQTITVNTVATPLPRVATNGRSSVYESPSGDYRLTISHSVGKRERSVVRIDHKKIGADALNPVTNRQYDEAVYIVMDKPLFGFTDDESKHLMTALVDLTKTTNFMTKFLGQES